MKKYLKVISITLFTILLLAFLFWWGGDSPSLHGFTEKEEKIDVAIEAKAESQKTEEAEAFTPPTEEKEEETPAVKPAPAEKKEIKKETPPPPVQKEETAIQKEVPAPTEKKEDTCFISVRCDTILKNKEYVKSEIFEIIPQNGVIMAECEIAFRDGESVFDVLLRETKRQGIHLEFVKTPGYNSAYIEGTANIYEFDCGELSGWMYKVNGSFPEVGCSEHILKDGDKVEWVYTCDSGKDVGAKRPLK